MLLFTVYLFKLKIKIWFILISKLLAAFLASPEDLNLSLEEDAPPNRSGVIPQARWPSSWSCSLLHCKAVQHAVSKILTRYCMFLQPSGKGQLPARRSEMQSLLQHSTHYLLQIHSRLGAREEIFLWLSKEFHKHTHKARFSLALVLAPILSSLIVSEHSQNGPYSRQPSGLLDTWLVNVWNCQ